MPTSMSFAARRVLWLGTWWFWLAARNLRRVRERSESPDQGDVDNAAGAESLVCCGAKGGESGCEGLLMNVTPPQASAIHANATDAAQASATARAFSSCD